nr:Chain PA, AVAEKQ peptide [synthetic construct]7Q8I_PB Chain PB, AVAEKQ peptide [synthetic construct]
AVAEKQ